MTETSTIRLFCPCGTEIFRKPSSSGRGGKNPTYCEPCKRKRTNEAVKAHGRRQRAGGAPPTEFTCQDCKKVFPRPSKFGALPKRCVACLPAHEAERLRLWSLENIEKIYANARNGRRKRRALLKGAKVEKFAAEEIYERDRWRCQLCGKKVSKRRKWPHHMSPSLDHIMPIALGGDHVRSNVQLAHVQCNRLKQDHPAGEQMLLLG